MGIDGWRNVAIRVALINSLPIRSQRHCNATKSCFVVRPPVVVRLRVCFLACSISKHNWVGKMVLVEEQRAQCPNHLLLPLLPLGLLLPFARLLLVEDFLVFHSKRDMYCSTFI